MSRSLIQVANQSTQNLAIDSVVNPGTTIRRFGKDLRLNGNSIEIAGTGYYTVSGTLTVTPNAVGNVAAALYLNGVQIPGTLVGGSVSTVGNSTTLPFETTLRRGCCCDTPDILTCRLITGASSGTNYSLRVVEQ